MALSLSSDIIDHLLTSLPDFATLLSAILVSKSFHEAFQAHPSSILNSVATNQISLELLPCALRLAHFNKGEYLGSRTNYVQNFPLEKRFFHNEAPAVTTHLVALNKNDSIVTELELFFSTTCKDRSSGTQSLLNPRESLRFRRALYRWLLMTHLFPQFYPRPTRTARENRVDEEGDTEVEDYTEDEDYTDVDTDDDDDSSDIDAPNVFLEKSPGLRKKFLSEFSDCEVAEMWQVDNFMVFVSSCGRNAVLGVNTPHDPFLSWEGPAVAAEILRTLRSFNEPNVHCKDKGTWDYNRPDSWLGFLSYLDERNYDTSKVGTNTWDPVQDKNVILDDKVEDTKKCDGCHDVFLSPKLWDFSNWHLLPCAITFAEVIDSLPGWLGQNHHERRPLEAVPWSFSSFVNRHVSPGIPDWSEGKLLCKSCVLKIVGRRTLDSLREDKAQQGTQLEDCWYGYKCRTQRKYNHAVKLNV